MTKQSVVDIAKGWKVEKKMVSTICSGWDYDGNSVTWADLKKVLRLKVDKKCNQCKETL